MDDDGPPPYTLCDPYLGQGWLPRNVIVSMCTLGVNIAFIVWYIRLHRRPPGVMTADGEVAGVRKPAWGFGANKYLFRESLFGVFVTAPTLLWFFVFHSANPEYACAWQYGLYGFPVVYLQSAVIPLIVFLFGVRSRAKHHQAYDAMHIKPTDVVLLLPGYRGDFLPALVKKVPAGHVCCVDAYDTRWQPESELWIRGNVAAMGWKNVEVTRVLSWDDLPFANAEFDVVIGCFMGNSNFLNQPFDLLSDKQDKAVTWLRECRRVLRPGGRIHLIEMAGKEKAQKANLCRAGFHRAHVLPDYFWFSLVPERVVSGFLFDVGPSLHRQTSSGSGSRSTHSKSVDPEALLSEPSQPHLTMLSGVDETAEVPSSPPPVQRTMPQPPLSYGSHRSRRSHTSHRSLMSHGSSRAQMNLRAVSAPAVMDASIAPDMVLPWLTSHAWNTHLAFRLTLIAPLALAYVFAVLYLQRHWAQPPLDKLVYLPFFNQVGQALLDALWAVPILLFWMHENISAKAHQSQLHAKRWELVKVFAYDLALLPLKLAGWTCFVFWPSWLIDYNLGQTLTTQGIYAVQWTVNVTLWLVTLALVFVVVFPALDRWRDRRASARRNASEMQSLLGQGAGHATVARRALQRQRSVSTGTPPSFSTA